MKHPRLIKFLYAHPVLAVLLPYVPALAVCFGLYHFQILDSFFATILAVWLLFLLLLPVRSAYRSLLTYARVKLERDCDAEEYLAIIGFMLNRPLPYAKNTTLMTHYAVGLDAAGRTEDAVEWFNKILQKEYKLPTPVRFQVHLARAFSVAHHKEAGKYLPPLIEKMEKLLPTLNLPPFYLIPFQAGLETVRDAARFHAGELDGLRGRYVARINDYARHPNARANKINACLWLARVYEREGEVTEARAMYAYVAENGGTLGAVAEAKEALARLSPTENEV